MLGYVPNSLLLMAENANAVEKQPRNSSLLTTSEMMELFIEDTRHRIEAGWQCIEFFEQQAGHKMVDTG